MSAVVLGNRYVLRERIGGGGMGVVFRAYDRLTGQHVALKQVTRTIEDLQIGTSKRRLNLRLALAQEFRVLSALRHPHIISVLDYGFDDSGQPYFTMDLLENAPNILEAGWSGSYDSRMKLLAQMLQALAYLHRWGILHRDLKPENVMVVNGEVKLLDFGLALWRDQAEADDVTGTLAYMAPEILNGYPATEAADLYAAGVIGYELFAERHLYDFNTVTMLVNDILNTPVNTDPLDITHPVADVLKRLLAKNPLERYASAASTLNALNVATGRRQTQETQAIRESFLQAAPFVGRESERAQLVEALDQAIKGHGSAWLIGGESGVGKSRLLDDVQPHALVGGVHLLRGQAVSEGSSPYTLWRDALRRLVLMVDINDADASVVKAIVPDIDTLLDRPIPAALDLEPGPTQARLLGIMTGLFRHLQQPTVILLEDLQWAGSESLALLNQINQVIADLPLLIVGTFRNDERPDLPDRFPSMRLIELTRLTPDEIARLSESMLGESGAQPRVVNLLERETEGNVFFLVEVVRTLAEEAGSLERVGTMPLPDQVFAGGIRRIIQRRLERVPERWHELLKIAALAGRQIDLAILVAIVRTREWVISMDGFLSACANAAVVEIYEGYWRFPHDKLREGIISSLTLVERQSLHRQIAEAIEQVYAGDETQTPALAHHWDMAGVPAKAVDYHLKAGHLAFENSAHREAIVFFERGLKLLEALNIEQDRRDQRAAIMVELSGAYWGVSRYDDAERLSRESLALYREINHPLGIANALKSLGDVARRRGDFNSAHSCYLEALTLCRTAGDPIAVGLTLARLGNLMRNWGNSQQGIDYYNEALQIFKELGERPRLATIYSGLGLLASDLGQYPEARQHLQISLEIAREVHNPGGTGLILTGLAWVNYLEGNYQEARRLSLESLSLSREVDERWMTANNLGNLGKIMTNLQDYDAADIYLSEALQIATEIGAVPLLLEILTSCAGTLTARGRHEQAAELLALAYNHPATYNEVKQQTDALMPKLRLVLPPEILNAALIRGSQLDLAATVQKIISREF